MIAVVFRDPTCAGIGCSIWRGTRTSIEGLPSERRYLVAAAQLEVLCGPTKGNPAPMTNVRLDMDPEADS